MKREIQVSEHNIIIYEPDSKENYPIIYMHANDEKQTDEIYNNLSGNDFILACIQNVDWDKYMSPWPAKKVFKSSNDFEGKADEHLDLLLKNIIPEVEKSIDYKITDRGLIGYSLSGLFALYSLCKTDTFTMIGSMSGSLWFEGWIEFIEENHIAKKSPKVYLSLGDKEHKTRNERMATIEDCTNKTVEILKAQGSDVLFEMNSGNHFANVPERITKGIKWLIK